VVAVYDCSYYELFGRIEYETVYGAAVTDHRRVRPGAVHRAAGGYLLLQAADVLAKPFVWGRLKELLRTGKARTAHGSPRTANGSRPACPRSATSCRRPPTGRLRKAPSWSPPHMSSAV
jgi:predicted ATP-dependent protease